MTPIVIRRMDGGPRLVIEGQPSWRTIFLHLDPSSNGPQGLRS